VPPARARTVDIVALQFAAADQTRGWFSGPVTFAETGAKEVEISAILDDGRICLTALPFSGYLGGVDKLVTVGFRACSLGS